MFTFSESGGPTKVFCCCFWS